MAAQMAGLAELLAPRRKAVLALLIPLVGGLGALHPHNHALQLAGVLLTALGTAVGVHQVPNRAPSKARAQPPAGPPVGTGG